MKGTSGANLFTRSFSSGGDAHGDTTNSGVVTRVFWLSVMGHISLCLSLPLSSDFITSSALQVTSSLTFWSGRGPDEAVVWADVVAVACRHVTRTSFPSISPLHHEILH